MEKLFPALGVTPPAAPCVATFIRLDMGTLDLGLIRDSVVEPTNDYQVFGETFENVAKAGFGRSNPIMVTTTTAP